MSAPSGFECTEISSEMSGHSFKSAGSLGITCSAWRARAKAALSSPFPANRRISGIAVFPRPADAGATAKAPNGDKSQRENRKQQGTCDLGFSDQSSDWHSPRGSKLLFKQLQVFQHLVCRLIALIALFGCRS